MLAVLSPQVTHVQSTFLSGSSYPHAAEKKGSITPGRGQEDPASGDFGKFFKAGGTTQADMVRLSVICLMNDARTVAHTCYCPQLRLLSAHVSTCNFLSLQCLHRIRGCREY